MRAITLMLAILATTVAHASDTQPAPQSAPAVELTDEATSPSVNPKSEGQAAGASTTGLQAGLDAYQRGDYPAALKGLIPLANKGDATAQLRLGMMSEFGQGVTKNYQHAVVRYHQAAEQGNAEAQFHLGILYVLGQGVPQSKKIAAEWYGKSAAQGYAPAKASLAALSQVVKATTPASLATGAAALPDPSNSHGTTPQFAVQDAKLAIVRQKTKLATKMPGVGKLSGSSAVFNASVIRVSADRNEVVYVSSAYPNRISTPFRHPMLVGALPDGYNDETIKVVGSSMYFPAVDQSLAVFMTGNDLGDQVVSLTLIPKDIPAQTLSLMLDGAESSLADRKSDATPSSYTDALVAKFRSIAMGKVPQGFSSAKMPPTIAREGELIIIPEERFSGQKLDIYRYRVENAGKGMVELAETSFYENGVRGVAIYPNLKLNAGESTYVFVAADKGMSDTGVAEPVPSAAGE